MTPDCARCAQGHRGTCGLAAELPPLGDWPRGSQVWQGYAPAPRTARDARRGVGGHAAWLRSYRRSATGLAARRSGRAMPCTQDCARCAQGRRGTCGLAAELPPLGNRPRGSQVWCGFPAVGRYRPPFGDGPHGLLSQSSLFEEQAGLFRWGKFRVAVEKTFLLMSATKPAVLQHNIPPDAG